MHPWNLSEDEARELQESLANDCILEGNPEVETIAALDVSIYPESKIGIASAINYSVTSHRIIEEVILLTEVTFPYISGLLAFREAPPMIEAASCLKTAPDCYLIDGHGYAHPRRVGLASHIGLFLDAPTIGCAKNILVGEYEEPGKNSGDYSKIWDGEPLGYAMRSKENAGPIFLSPGHRISREVIPEIIKPLLNNKSRLPEPLRLANQQAKKERRKLEIIARPFLDEKSGVFLVGGTVRDLLLGKRPSDYDLLVTGFSEKIKDELAEEFSGNWFTLDEKRKMYRLPGDESQIDVAVVDGQEVVEDLNRRDFTINSIALDLQREGWIDPVEGREDAAQRLLRPTREDSIEEDPLRILRAYRLAKQHRLSLTDSLRAQVRENSSRLEEVSKERTVAELLELVAGVRASRWLEMMLEEGVFSSTPFFRYEGPHDCRLLETWTPVLKNHSLLAGNYHAGFTLYDGFKAARLLTQKNISDWPLHRHIKQTALSSYRELPVEPDPEAMLLNSKHLIGRLLGRGLWENWDKDQMLRGMLALENYLEARNKLEKELVDELKGDPELGVKKEKRLIELLPPIWAETLASI